MHHAAGAATPHLSLGDVREKGLRTVLRKAVVAAVRVEEGDGGGAGQRPRVVDLTDRNTATRLNCRGEANPAVVCVFTSLAARMGRCRRRRPPRRAAAGLLQSFRERRRGPRPGVQR
jgi:hypothetical protein